MRPLPVVSKELSVSVTTWPTQLQGQHQPQWKACKSAGYRPANVVTRRFIGSLTSGHEALRAIKILDTLLQILKMLGWDLCTLDGTALPHNPPLNTS